MAMKKHRAVKTSGSPRHTEMSGPGYGAANPSGQVVAGGPGKAAGRVQPHFAAKFEGGANSYTPPKMAKYDQE